MAEMTLTEAANWLARGIERMRPDDLREVYAELEPTVPPTPVNIDELAALIRSGLAPEQLVDLWNVIFPADRHVQYDDESRVIQYEDGSFEYAG